MGGGGGALPWRLVWRWSCQLEADSVNREAAETQVNPTRSHVVPEQEACCPICVCVCVCVSVQVDSGFRLTMGNRLEDGAVRGQGTGSVALGGLVLLSLWLCVQSVPISVDPPENLEPPQSAVSRLPGAEGMWKRCVHVETGWTECLLRTNSVRTSVCVATAQRLVGSP